MLHERLLQSSNATDTQRDRMAWRAAIHLDHAIAR
jgi:hypothetical protein